MKLVRISDRAKAMLRNRKLASAVSMAIASNSNASLKEGIVVTVNGKNYTIKSVSPFSR